MMVLRRLVAVLLVFGFALAASACADLAEPGRLAPGVTATAVRGVLATRQLRPSPQLSAPLPTVVLVNPTASTTLPAVSSPTSPPVPLAATAVPDGFCCLRFAVAPDAGPAAVFPSGTETIHAVWDYTSLKPGDRVRRIWFRDDLIWITREETWNWETYGASGTVSDVAVYDFEGDGLLPADYRLQLYINDVLQTEGVFTISPP